VAIINSLTKKIPTISVYQHSRCSVREPSSGGVAKSANPILTIRKLSCRRARSPVAISLGVAGVLRRSVLNHKIGENPECAKSELPLSQPYRLWPQAAFAAQARATSIWYWLIRSMWVATAGCLRHQLCPSQDRSLRAGRPHQRIGRLLQCQDARSSPVCRASRG